MTFKVSTTGHFYDDKRKKKLEKLGFTFEPNRHDAKRPWYNDYQRVEVEINSLEELMAFQDKWGTLVLSEGELEIYDDYRE